MKIQLCNLSVHLSEIQDEIDSAMRGVVGSGVYILGPEVEAFESEVANYLNAGEAVGVNSGTDALTIGLRSVGIGQGDEVLVPSFTFFATVESILMAGATPVFVDIDPVSFNISAEAAEAAITESTKAIVPVHLYGRTAAMHAIQEIAIRHDLIVAEDVAQAFGASHAEKKAGTSGDVGAFSFFPSKNLGALGDGGLIATDDSDVARTARALRTHGASRKYHNEMLGYNSRLDALQAAVLRVKLPHLDRWNESRRAAAKVYGELLADHDEVRLPEITETNEHVYHQFTVRIPDGKRNKVRESLASRGIGCAVYYPVPIHRLPLFVDGSWELPETERAAQEVLSLPMYPGLEFGDQELVVKHLLEALRL